jgi:hypothetical protein
MGVLVDRKRDCYSSADTNVELFPPLLDRFAAVGQDGVVKSLPQVFKTSDRRNAGQPNARAGTQYFPHSGASPAAWVLEPIASRDHPA